MFTAEHELHVVESFLGQEGQSLGAHLDDFLALKLAQGNAFLAQKAVFGLVFAQLEHRGVLECWC